MFDFDLPVHDKNIDFDVISEEEFLSSPESYSSEDEVELARCVWDGYKMVTEEEFAAEMESGALAYA